MGPGNLVRILLLFVGLSNHFEFEGCTFISNFFQFGTFSKEFEAVLERCTSTELAA